MHGNSSLLYMYMHREVVRIMLSIADPISVDLRSQHRLRRRSYWSKVIPLGIATMFVIILMVIRVPTTVGILMVWIN